MFYLADLADVGQKNADLLENMATEISNLKDEISNLKDASVVSSEFHTRMIEVERRISLQDQYSRRENIDIVNIPEEIADGEDLEFTVVDIFNSAGVKVHRRDFHAIHRKKGNSTVIARLVNRRDAIAILRAKGKVRSFSSQTKNSINLDTNKTIYINENLCPNFSRLQGISNSLFKRKEIAGFYTINGMLRLKLLDGSTGFVSHIQDLHKLFGDLIEQLVKDHEVRMKAKQPQP